MTTLHPFSICDGGVSIVGAFRFVLGCGTAGDDLLAIPAWRVSFSTFGGNVNYVAFCPFVCLLQFVYCGNADRNGMDL